MKQVLFLLIAICGLWHTVTAQSVEAEVLGDTRGFSTVNITSVGGYARWEGFGFIDLHKLEGRSEFFLRIQGRYRLKSWLLAEVEADAGTGFATRLRPGIVVRKPLKNGFIDFKYFPVQTNLAGGKTAIAVMVPLSSRVRLEGFTDYYWKQGWIVAEPALRIRAAKQWDVVIEGRHWGYLNSHRDSVAIGVIYRFDR